MKKDLLYAFTIFLFCLVADGHYLPARHHWQKAFHYPSIHRMHHGLTEYPYVFRSHPSNFESHPFVVQGQSSTFQTHGPALLSPEATESRPAFPAPGSLTGARADQSIDILTSLIALRSGSPLIGSLGLLRAF